MAVITSKNFSSLKIVYSKETDDGSKTVNVTKTYNYVDSDVSDEDLYAVANSIVSLQKLTLSTIIRVDNTSLSE